MEAAYDKAIMRRHAYGEERYPYLPVDMLDFTGIAAIWPNITEHAVQTSIHASHVLKKAFDTKRVLILAGKLGKSYSKLCFWNDAQLLTKEQARHEKSLDRFYDQALKDGAEMIETLFYGIGRDQPLHERFKVNFFGERVEF